MRVSFEGQAWRAKDNKRGFSIGDPEEPVRRTVRRAHERPLVELHGRGRAFLDLERETEGSADEERQERQRRGLDEHLALAARRGWSARTGSGWPRRCGRARGAPYLRPVFIYPPRDHQTLYARWLFNGAGKTDPRTKLGGPQRLLWDGSWECRPWVAILSGLGSAAACCSLKGTGRRGRQEYRGSHQT